MLRCPCRPLQCPCKRFCPSVQVRTRVRMVRGSCACCCELGAVCGWDRVGHPVAAAGRERGAIRLLQGVAFAPSLPGPMVEKFRCTFQFRTKPRAGVARVLGPPNRRLNKEVGDMLTFLAPGFTVVFSLSVFAVALRVSSSPHIAAWASVLACFICGLVILLTHTRLFERGWYS